MTHLSEQDKQLLEELCTQHDVSVEKVIKLLSTVREYEFKDRRTGIYAALKKSYWKNPGAEMASYLKKYIDHPGKTIDILEKVINKIAGRVDFNDYEANSVQLTEVTKVIESLNEKGVDVPEELRRLKSTLSLAIHDQEKIIQQLQGLEIRLSSVLDSFRLRLSKKGQATTTRRLKKRYVLETSPMILQKEIRKAIRELGGKGRKKEIIEIIQRNLEGKFKKNDRVRKKGTEQWILNVTKERSFMIRDGILKSGSPRGIWELRGR